MTVGDAIYNHFGYFDPANPIKTVTLTLNGAGSGDIMITQYYEGSGNNKWIEVKNVSGAIIPANTYYIVVLNNADADNPTAADPSNAASPSPVKYGSSNRILNPLSQE